MVEWDNTLGGRTCKMGRGALQMGMISGPAPLTGAQVGALICEVSWVLTMTLEAVEERRKSFLSLA